MKNISLIIFALFNYFVFQNYLKNNNVKIISEVGYQKTFNEPVDESSGPIFKTNIIIPYFPIV